MEKYLSYNEAAAFLCVSPQRIGQLISSRMLQGGPKIGRKRTVMLASIEAYRERNRINRTTGNTVLEQVYNKCQWDRKFIGYYPQRNIKYAWHLINPDECHEAIRELPKMAETTKDVCRALFLCSGTAGQILIVTEESW